MMRKRVRYLALLPWLSAATAVAQGPAPAPAAPAATADAPKPAPETKPPAKAPPEEGATLYMPSLYGPTGILRVFAADGGQGATFRVGLIGEFFRATNFLLANDRNTKIGGRLALSVSPWEWLEFFAVLQGTSNDNDRSTPTLIQTQGDFQFGLKGCYRVYDFFCVGAEGSLLFLTGAGDISFNGRSTSALLRLLASWDARRLRVNLPLRAHFNFGAIIDNSDVLIPRPPSPSMDAAQRFALRLNEANRLFLGLGVEAPVNRWVNPFLEWSLEIPVGLPASLGSPSFSAYPHILSLGARVSPWRQLHLLAALDIGITSSGHLGVPAVPPWQLVFGVGWSFSLAEPPPRIVEKEKIKEVIKEKEKVVTREVPVTAPPTAGVLTGQVVDARTAKPVPGAVLRFPGTDYTAVLSGDARGDFRVGDLKPGKLRVRVEKDGFKPADFEVDIVAGQPTANSFPIDAAEQPKMGVLVGKIADEDGKPLVGIVEAQAAKGGPPKKLVAEPSTGAFVGRLEVGDYTLTARSTGYLSRERAVSLNLGERVVVDFSLRKEPEKRLARIEGQKIVIDKQVNFKRASAKIVGKVSFALLDEVVDILVRNRQIKKVRIEGHTDNRGGKSYNQKLSERRARSVMEYLVAQGISPSRLEHRGYGQTKPLVPNTSRRNRARNRRVEITILEQ